MQYVAAKSWEDNDWSTPSSSLTVNRNIPIILTGAETNSNDLNTTQLVQEPEEYQSEGSK